MAQTQLGVVLTHLHRLLGPPAPDATTDRQLLDRFTAQRDETAFEEVLRRHGAMVLGVCRRLLPGAHDAEDVFQATFLVLVHRAASIRKGTSLGCWLYGVAYRLALKARTGAARRRAHERRVADMRPTDASGEPSWDEVRPLLDEELSQLPERLRAPLVLCYLEGKSNVQAAQELGRPVGSMSKLLARARETLRHRLIRRGVALSAATLGLLLAENLDAAVPAALGRATLAAGLRTAAGAAVAGVVSARVANLVQGGIRDMFLAKCKVVLALVLTLAALAAGAGALMTPQPQEAKPVAAEKPPAPQPKAILDQDGDPLPTGALLRLGTQRLRHGHNALMVAFAPDGKSLLSTAGDHLARRWDVTTGREIGNYGQQTDRDKAYSATRWVHAVAVAPDGKTVATGDHNPGWQVRTIHLWNASDGKEVRTLQGHTDGILCLAYSPDGKTLVSASADGTLRLWDPDKGTERQSLAGHEGAVRWVVWSHDGKQLASTGADGTVRLWDPDKGTEVHSFKAHDGGAFGIGFSPDGKKLVSCGNDKTARLWDLSARPCKELHKVEREKPIRAVAFSPDGSLIACGGGDNVLLWDPDTGKEYRHLKGPHNEICSIAFSPDSKQVAAVAFVHSTVFLWEATTGKRLAEQTGHDGGQVGRLNFSSDGQVITSCCGDWTLRQWDAATGRQLRRIEIKQTNQHAATLAPDGKTVACGGWAGFVRLHDPTGKETRAWKGHDSWVTAVAYAPDGKTLASSGNDRTVALWDPATGKELHRFTIGGDGEPPSDVVFSPDGQLLAVIVRGQQVRLWEVATGKERHLEPPPPAGGIGGGAGGIAIQGVSPVESAAFSPDSRLLATGGRDNSVHLWDLSNGQQIRVFPGHVGWVLAVAFSPDGRTLAVGHWRTVSLWEVNTGKERRRFTGHEGDCSALAFAPNGRTLVCGCGDTTALIWDLTGRLDGGKLQAANLKGQELELAWTDLRGDDATRAYAALWLLASAPKQALPLLREALPRAAAVEADRIAKLIATLDDDDFEKRERATEQLVKMGEQAEAAVKKALAGKPSVEVRRRLEYVLEQAKLGGDNGERLRQTRALEVLEAMGTPEARALLEELTKGAPEAWLTREAKTVLARMK
jgi:RNA polymerase sigma factor (sigma-70 family)